MAVHGQTTVHPFLLRVHLENVTSVWLCLDPPSSEEQGPQQRVAIRRLAAKASRSTATAEKTAL